MDKLTEYPQLIKQILTEYIELCNRNPKSEMETFLLVDESKAHYIAVATTALDTPGFSGGVLLPALPQLTLTMS